MEDNVPVLEAVAGDDGLTDEERRKAEGVSKGHIFFSACAVDLEALVLLSYYYCSMFFVFVLRHVLAVVRVLS